MASACFYTLGAIGASEKYIGEGRWEWQQRRLYWDCYFFVSHLPGNPESLEKEKAREIACWFESYAQNTVSFEKFETEMGKRCCKEIGKMIAKGYIRNIQIDREKKLYIDYCTKQTCE